MQIEIIDNFLIQEDFKEIVSLLPNHIDNDKTGHFHTRFEKDKIFSQNFFDNSITQILVNNYHNKALKILEKIAPKKVKLYDYSDFSLIATGKNMNFPIHDDNPDKLLTGVIYLSPIQSTGTNFYKDKKGNGLRTIEWKQNRAVFFSRKEKQSWHSYKGDGVSTRYVLSYQLKTRRIQEVFSAEETNKYLGLMRYKFNPYIYKYFKFTI
jgi:hypothetical protein